MVWRVGLFYYAGSKTTPVSQIDDFVQEFNGVIITTNNEGRSADLTTQIQRINDFWTQSPGYQIHAEVPYYNSSGIPRSEQEMKDWIDSLENAVGSKIAGYYFTPEGADSMWNDRIKMRNVVGYAKSKGRYTLWIPIDDWDLSGDPLAKIADCDSYIGFTNITPQPHYYQVKSTSPSRCCGKKSKDVKRPNGMSYVKLVEFMQYCKNRGYGVEFECDSSVLKSNIYDCENCGCGVGTDCVMRARNYYCAAREVGGFTYIYHYFSNSIGNYRVVKNFNENTCPPGGFDTC